jgi:16S rRNA (uracil1498-N3)-methyltransferase
MIPRLYVTQDLIAGASFPADARAFHYLRNVMRRTEGDPVALFNGRDGEFAAEIAEIGKKAAAFKVGARRREQDSVVDLWLCFAPLKKDATDFLIEKGTELGAAAFQPVFTQHTASTRLNPERLGINAIEAAEQTERLTIPAILPAKSLDELIAGWDSKRRLILCAEAGIAAPIADALAGLGRSVSLPNKWAIISGPEGGFSASELDRLTKLPFVTPVGLGPRVLRADTAALAALAVFQSILGDGGKRPPRPLNPLS